MRDAAPAPIGPVLILDDIAQGRMHLAALFISPSDDRPAPIITAEGTAQPVALDSCDSTSVWRTRFTLPTDRAGWYEWNGVRYDVASDLRGDLRIAYVSCNGEEVGDMDRAGSERNIMWARLCDDHASAPFALLLHGGDQVYADEVTQGHDLSHDWPDSIPRDTTPAGLQDLRAHLRRGFLHRYAALYAAPQTAWLAARVPSLMQWDDHDICDGWGSLPRSRTYSPVGQTLFSEARAAFLTFQHAAAPGDLPARFADPGGLHLGWRVDGPGLRIIAPDLRSERTRRQVMGDGGWAFMDAEGARHAPGQTLLMSSVPLLGPRLSILEALMVATPSMQKYEDDLRDQWQSRAHRDEWRRMLRLVRDMARHDGQDIVALSGEIHLATRAEMDLGDGLALHQLVASGITHRAPPQAWARVLGGLSWLGESPLPAHPIVTRRLPAAPHRYMAERNYMVLERAGVAWSARWHLEQTGRTPALAL